MDLRPGPQAPLLPTLPPPLGLGLPPHLGLGPHQAHQLGLPFQSAGAPQSLPSSPSPGRPQPATASSKSTFAAALRDLAKNAGDPASPPGAPPSLPRRVATPVSSGLPMSSAASALTPSLTPSLLDVRKGFGRPAVSGQPSDRSTPSSPGSSDHLAPGGFQPYRSHLAHPAPPPAPPGTPGPFPPFHPPGLFSSGPGSLPGLPSLYGQETDPLYQAGMARYLATLQTMGVSPGHPGFPPLPSLPPSLPPGLHPASLPPSVLAGYPPELLQAYGLAGPAGSQADLVARLQEARRLELEARKDLAKTRERSERASPAAPLGKKLSSDGRDGRDSRDSHHLKLARLSSPAASGRSSAVSSDLRLPEVRPVSPSDSVKSASPTPSSPSPPPDPDYTVSRCRPYVPKPRSVLGPLPDDQRASTPKKMFVRPFEDNYSPVLPPSEHLDISASSLSPDKEGKGSSTNVDLDDIVKPDDQDSDYESMSSDSSIKKEGSSLCPSSGQILAEEESKEVVFLQPETDVAQHKDKLKYLRYFRLVTHRKKNDIEIKKLERRRARLRERSPTPPPHCEARPGSPELPLPSTAPHLNRLPETHAKAMYLSAIGLCRNTEEQKVSNELIWSVVLEDRLTRERERERPITKYFVRLRELSEQQNQEVTGRGVKRSWEERERDRDTFLPPSHPLDPASTMAVSPRAQLNIPSCETVSRLTTSDSSPSPPTQVEINLCSLQPLAKPSLLLQEVKTEPGSPQAPLAPPAHLQPHLGFSKVLSASPYKAEVKTEPEDLSVVRKKKPPASPLIWPGVEAVLESYKQFTADCEAEKSLLQERQSRAQAEVVARRGQVDNLSTRLSSLARLHKTLVGNHAHTAASLETVRSQLVAISKLVSGGGTNK